MTAEGTGEAGRTARTRARMGATQRNPRARNRSSRTRAGCTCRGATRGNSGRRRFGDGRAAAEPTFRTWETSGATLLTSENSRYQSTTARPRDCTSRRSKVHQLGRIRGRRATGRQGPARSAGGPCRTSQRQDTASTSRPYRGWRLGPFQGDVGTRVGSDSLSDGNRYAGRNPAARTSTISLHVTAHPQARA